MKGTTAARNSRIGIMYLRRRIILYFCRTVVGGGAGNNWRFATSRSGWPFADSESGVDSKSGGDVYQSVALVMVCGCGGVCGKIRRFNGLPGEDDFSGELAIMTCETCMVPLFMIM